MGTQTPIRIVIVDDHAMLRKGLAVFLNSYADLKLVGEAANGKESVALCADKRPDIVLMDLLMLNPQKTPCMRELGRDHVQTDW